MSAIFPYILPSLALLFAIYSAWSNRGMVKEKENQEVIKKIQVTIDDHTLRHQLHQQERERSEERHEQRFHHMEQRVSLVDTLLNEVNALKLKQETILVQLADLKDSFKDMKESGRESAKEIMELIKKGASK